jgi:hypothetical protein
MVATADFELLPYSTLILVPRLNGGAEPGSDIMIEEDEGGCVGEWAVWCEQCESIVSQ